MNYYVGLFPKGRVVELTRFGKDQQGPEGKLLNGTFELLGQRFYVMDMEPGTPPAFSWATSILVHCADEAEFDALFAGLSRGGSVMMGPEPVMEIRKAAWVTDRFGVTAAHKVASVCGVHTECGAAALFRSVPSSIARYTTM